MEGRPLEVQGLSGLAHAPLSGAKASEVLGSAGHHVGAELDRQTWTESANMRGTQGRVRNRIIRWCLVSVMEYMKS